MTKTKNKEHDCPFTDLFLSNKSDRFFIQSWRDSETIYFQFGITTLAIPLEDWPSFISAVNSTEFNRKAEEQAALQHTPDTNTVLN